MRTPARYRASVKFLKNAGDDWRKLIELVGPCLHDPKAAHEPHEALVHAIAYQQLTAKTGDATIKAISEGALSGLVPTREVAVKMDDRALIERIISIKGIGRWTVEMLLMYSLERMDVLPVDDFGIRKGYRIPLRRAQAQGVAGSSERRSHRNGPSRPGICGAFHANAANPSRLRLDRHSSYPARSVGSCRGSVLSESGWLRPPRTRYR
jgi:3-methyladenine DNA glycosylase/8-oxoguanine DNA glycosylase